VLNQQIVVSVLIDYYWLWLLQAGKEGGVYDATRQHQNNRSGEIREHPIIPLR